MIFYCNNNTIWSVKKNLKTAIFVLFCAFICMYCLFPFYWAIVSSLKEPADIFFSDLLPKRVTLDNYVNVVSDSTFIRSFLNSFIVATCTSLIALFVAFLAAYPLGRMNFKGNKCLMLSFLGFSTLPHVAVLSGMFELISVLNLYNTRIALIIAYMLATIPFTVWVLTGFMKSLPRELEEAAIMDGAGRMTILFRVFMPIMMPSMVTTGLLAFITAWNEFLFALTFTLTNNARTVPVAIALFSGASQHELPWGLIMTASVIVTLPLIILVIIFQRKIISGLMAGAVKG